MQDPVPAKPEEMKGNRDRNEQFKEINGAFPKKLADKWGWAVRYIVFSSIEKCTMQKKIPHHIKLAIHA
jgi:hypothetical protein